MADSPTDKLAEQALNQPILAPGHNYASVTDKISAIVLRRPPKWWILGFAGAFALVMLLLYAMTYLFVVGVGIWGIQIPVGWGFAIINFVWWIGIGHAGTLISAILLLLRQQWRTSINRFAEAMTLFAVACAGIFPLIHMGRPWLAYWLFPYPDTMKMWPNFRSPLVWDAFAVSTYATVSALFWFIGLLPDLATLRDRAKNRAAKIIYGFLAMGWRGSAVHWHRHETASLLLAGLATPLVLSVHTIVSFDFAVRHRARMARDDFPAVLRGRRDLRGICHGADAFDSRAQAFWPGRFHHHASPGQHGQGIARHRVDRRLRLHDGSVLRRYYSGNQYERFMILNRMGGPYAPMYWCLDRLQHRDAAIPVVPQSAFKGRRAVRHRHGRERGNVARAVCDRGHQLAPRFHALRVGNVLPDAVGLCHFLWHHRAFPGAAFPVHPVPAADFYF